MAQRTARTDSAASTAGTAGVPGLAVQRVAGALGAEVAGVDLSKPASEELIAALRAALLEHGVLFFRGQDLGPGQYMAFAERFGEPNEYPFIKGMPDHPLIIEVIKREQETINFGGVWHSDTTYLEHPPMGTLLLAREVPPYGGDTIFANQYLAYEALSPGMRKLLEGLVGISSSAKADATRTREDRIRENAHPDLRRDYLAEHPVVRTHPETGRKALFVNVAHTVGIKGFSEEESAALLGFLFRHQVRPEFTCRFSWHQGSLAFWDNRCVQHNAVNDYHGHRRVMHRITLAGDRPR